MYTVKSNVFMYIRWKMPQISKSDMIETIVLNMHTVFFIKAIFKHLSIFKQYMYAQC